jgi:hypothetical protein
MFFEPARWMNLISKEDDGIAGTLALCKDMVTFLDFLKENKVTGTQSTGNFPRKAIEEITPRFVNPPPLDTKIGNAVLRYRGEDDIWPIYFIHVLVQGAGLINGGPVRRWRLTQVGDLFLTLPAIAKIRTLFAA